MVLEKVRPAADPVVIGGIPLLLVLIGAAAVVSLNAVWRRLRLAVTLVHELGHAVVGMAVGRKFSGFVLRADASGHAITSGRPRGPGMIATTWAGYPAPALLGAVMVWATSFGWAAPLLTAVLLVLILAVIRIRSLLTAVVLVSTLAAAGALWWWRSDELQAGVLVGVGVVLIVGAWRHLGAVASSRGRSRGSDPDQLARLTPLPAAFWVLSFAVALLAATWLAAASLWPGLRQLLG